MQKACMGSVESDLRTSPEGQRIAVQSKAHQESHRRLAMGLPKPRRPAWSSARRSFRWKPLHSPLSVALIVLHADGLEVAREESSTGPVSHCFQRCRETTAALAFAQQSTAHSALRVVLQLHGAPSTPVAGCGLCYNARSTAGTKGCQLKEAAVT